MIDIAEKHHQDMASGMTYFAIAALVAFFIILLIFFYYKYMVSKKKKREAMMKAIITRLDNLQQDGRERG